MRVLRVITHLKFHWNHFIRPPRCHISSRDTFSVQEPTFRKPARRRYCFTSPCFPCGGGGRAYVPREIPPSLAAPAGTQQLPAAALSQPPGSPQRPKCRRCSRGGPQTGLLHTHTRYAPEGGPRSPSPSKEAIASPAISFFIDALRYFRDF